MHRYLLYLYLYYPHALLALFSSILNIYLILTRKYFILKLLIVLVEMIIIIMLVVVPVVRCGLIQVLVEREHIRERYRHTSSFQNEMKNELLRKKRD